MNPLADQDLADIDRHFARFIERFGGDSSLIRLAATVLSRSVREGHICLSLRYAPAESSPGDQGGLISEWPSVEHWRSVLAKSEAVGRPEAMTPLVLDEFDRLYLRRYWNYQERLAAAVRQKAAANAFKNKSQPGTQTAAIEAALANSFTIISGGPGTGKTSTVLRILADLFQQEANQNLRVALATPTGKAAARLEATVRAALDKLECLDEVRARIPTRASTIHRLLGRKGNSVYFRHNDRKQLPIDLLVIDEASMVALPLLCKVLDALPSHCRVILIGDHEQLASVEPGAVLADMVQAARSPGSPLTNAVVTLETNYRFGKESGIHHLCHIVRRGDVDDAIQTLRQNAFPDLVSHEIDGAPKLVPAFSQTILEGLSGIVTERDPKLALAKLESFRVLTALRRGPFGAEGMNREIERVLVHAGVISEQSKTDSNYAGKPILIAKNDYQLQLFNGDIGVLLPDPNAAEDRDRLWAWFAGNDNLLRRFAPTRLPEHQTAYAMTVHKSQGSEFDRVLFILPNTDTPVLTRELIYTGLTRARSQLEIWWSEEILANAVRRRAERTSGLRDLLAAPVTKIGKERPVQLSLFE